MTCIAALTDGRTIGIAGERGASDNNNIVRLATPKIWRSGDYLFGASGTMESQHLIERFTPPADIDELIPALAAFYERMSIPRDSEMELIVCHAGNIYHHSPSDLSLSRFTESYVAIGSGYEYAYGSLFSSKGSVKQRLHQAVAAACEYSPTCKEPIDVITARV